MSYNKGPVYNSASQSSQVMTSLILPSIIDGGERMLHTDFGDNITTTSSDTASQSWWPIPIWGLSELLCSE